MRAARIVASVAGLLLIIGNVDAVRWAVVSLWEVTHGR